MIFEDLLEKPQRNMALDQFVNAVQTLSSQVLDNTPATSGLFINAHIFAGQLHRTMFTVEHGQ